MNFVCVFTYLVLEVNFSVVVMAVIPQKKARLDKSGVVGKFVMFFAVTYFDNVIIYF